MKKKLRRILILVLALVFVTSLTMLLRLRAEYSAGEEIYAEAIQIAIPEPPAAEPEQPQEGEAPRPPVEAPAEPPAEEGVRPEDMDLAALRAVSGDVIGWIWIPGTKLSYPLVQGEDNDYYLNHAWNGRKVSAGSIFIDFSCAADFSGYNTVIYGHSMDNGSMFRTLLNYKKQSYYDKYPEIYIYTPNGNYRMIIFAAYETKHDDLVYGKVYSEKGVEKLVNHAISKSKIKTKVEVSSKDKIVSLSTCAYSSKNARCIVMGKLVPADFSSSSQNESNLSQNDTNISNSGLFE